MSILDWSIVAVVLLCSATTVLVVTRYTRSVADFLAANRCAGRYLIAVSAGSIGMGAFTFIGFFEIFYKSGFTAAWWQLIYTVQFAIVAISGWVAYRYRQTRAMTLAQFLEMRYSRRLRIFAGLIAWMAGVVAFGIYPAITARFVVYFCGLPHSDLLFGSIMAVLLSMSLLFTFCGGQIAVIVAEFLNGVFANIVVLVVVLFLLATLGWSRIVEALSLAPPNHSLLNPFQAREMEDFNLWFFLIIALISVYGMGATQSAQGFSSCALSAHEARMANVLATWRVPGLFLTMMLIAASAYTLMHHADYAAVADTARGIIGGISNPQIQRQMTTSVAMGCYMPRGLRGAFAAMIVTASVGCQATYLQCWGSVFVQDVVGPLRSQPFSPRQHMTFLRSAILGVAVLVFLFSLLFRQTEYVHMFLAIANAIFTAGAGAVVIGGLYWKRGTTEAAWAAIITGAVLSMAAVAIRQINNTPNHAFVQPFWSFIASWNPAVLSLAVSNIAVSVYVLVSLLYRRRVFNLDRMLHRGQYVIQEHEGVSAVAPIRGWRSLIAMGNEFSRRDQIFYLATMSFTGSLIMVFAVGTIYNALVDVPTESWVRFWGIYVKVILTISVGTAVWFTVGGLRDLGHMFRLLARVKRNDLDDGWVVKDRNGNEASAERPPRPQ